MSYKSLLKKKADGSLSILGVLGVAMLMGSAVPVVTAIGYVIIAKAGIWWLPLLTVLLATLGVPSVFFIKRREMQTYHAQVGHEIYYGENPQALKRDLRKARKSRMSESAQTTAAYYRTRPTRFREFTEPREKSRRKKAVFLYLGAVITAAIGIFMIWRAFPIPKDFFRQELKTADFTSVFLILGGVLAVASAIGLALKKTIHPLRYATAIIMGLSVWSALVAYTLRKSSTYKGGVINAVCLVAFLIITFAVPALVGDVRTSKQVSHDRKELKIGLFELGYIKEEELREFY